MHIRHHTFLHLSDKPLIPVNSCSRWSSTERGWNIRKWISNIEGFYKKRDSYHIIHIQNNWLLVSHLWQKLVTSTVFWYRTKTTGKWQITLYSVCEHCYNEYYSNVVIWESINYKRWWRFDVINTQTFERLGTKDVTSTKF